MITGFNRSMRSRWRDSLVLCAVAAAAPAHAQAPQQNAPTPAAATQPSSNATVNLIRLLVQQGVITQENGDRLLAQAEAEAAGARAAQSALAAAPAPGTVRVPYVPEVVKSQLRDEIRTEVMAQAKTEGWASPGALPEWVKRIEWSGDIRFRSQSNLLASDNATGLIDFAAANAGGPFDINADTNPGGFPLLNTTRDRNNRINIRARIGLTAHVTDGVTAGVRLASGNDDSPVSTTQSLGGGFGKKDIWLDRAYVAIHPVNWGSITLGRMENPFRTTDLLFDEDLNFDGVAANVNSGDMLGDTVRLWATGGAFPFEYTSGSFPDKDVAKIADRNKWIFGGQLGVDWAVNDALQVKLGAAYYDFTNVEGQLSEPCALYNGNTQCSSDGTRPAFLSKGNSLFLIRDIIADPASPLNYAQPQFAGLSLDYNILDVRADLAAKLTDRLSLTVEGNYVRNLAYEKGDVCRYQPLGLPINNVGDINGYTNPCVAPSGGSAAPFISGNEAWMVRSSIGTPGLRKRGEWNVHMAYKRIEPDSMLDSLTDSDFHLGGTNARGYILGGNYMLFDNVRFGGRWLSANEVSGPPLSIDVLQLDLVVGF